MIRLLVVIVLLVINFGEALAESKCDSLVSEGSTRTEIIIPKNYSLSLKSLILPTTFIAVGSFTVSDNFLHHASYDASRTICGWSNHKPCMVEDYIQYVPVLAAVTLNFTGVKARHNFLDRFCITATAYAVMGATVNVGKWLVDEKRPDSNAHNSFPSGHTATAFMGAELVRIEYGGWCGIYAYAVATGVGFMRIYNGRHWLHDVVVGAGLGILCARIGEWSATLWQRIWKKKDSSVVISPMISTGHSGSYGVTCSAIF